MLISLSGSSTFRTQLLDELGQRRAVQHRRPDPQYRIDSLDALLRTPISVATAAESGVTATSMSGASGGSNSFVAASPTALRRLMGIPGRWRAARRRSPTWSP